MSEQHEHFVLVVDVANRITRLGAFVENELVGMGESSTPRHITTDEARTQIATFLVRALGGTMPYGAVLSSVVPSHTDAWQNALAEVAKTRSLVVGPGLKTGIRMRVESPRDVGSDRVANVVAARALHGAPVVVVSLGTTTNLEVVDKTGSFIGGAIAPGVMMGLRSLNDVAARLPLVEPQAPTSVVGKNTREAIQSGVILGEAARVDGLLNAIASQTGQTMPVVLTGHHAAIVAPLLQHEVSVEEALTLRGLNLIWQANR